MYLFVLWGSGAAIFIIIVFFLLEVDIVKNKTNLQLFSSLAIICLLLGYIIFLHISDQNKSTMSQKKYISSVNSFKSYNAENYINYQISRLEGLGESSEIREFLKEYFQTSYKSQEYLEVIKGELDEFTGPTDSVALLSAKGVIMASSIYEEEGLDYSDYSLENPDKNYFLIYYDKLLKEKMLAIVHTIREEDNVIGYVAQTMNLEELDGLTMSPYEYDSDYEMETFIIDKDGVLLTPSKFSKNDSGAGVFVQEIKSQVADKCREQLKSGEANVGSIYKYINHRGEDVLGAFSVISASQWCIVTEFILN